MPPARGSAVLGGAGHDLVDESAETDARGDGRGSRMSLTAAVPPPAFSREQIELLKRTIAKGATASAPARPAPMSVMRYAPSGRSTARSSSPIGKAVRTRSQASRGLTNTCRRLRTASRDQQVRCATRGCENAITFPAWESVCSKCISMQAEQGRIAAALLEAQRLKARLA